MKNKVIALILFSLVGCSSVPARVPVLADRTLFISEDVPGLEFRYSFCVKQFMGACFKAEDRREYFDLRDPDVRRLLNDTGFTARARGKCE
jgi:hypothetical protein